MKKELRVGLVIADDMEYIPMRSYVEKHGGRRQDMYGREGHVLSIQRDDRQIRVESVLCGIGMVNAAAATAFLIGRDPGSRPDYVINSGLSGGISGIGRGELTLGTRFVEHDFDLRPLGRELGEKPGQEYVYEADRSLLEHYAGQFPFMKPVSMLSGN